VFQGRSRLGEALEQALEAGKADSQRLAAQPSNLQAQLDVTFDLNQIASAYDAMGDPAKALDSYRRSLEIRRKLSDADPKDFFKRERLIYSETSVGNALLKTGGLEEAGQHFRAAAAIGTEMISRNPGDKALQSLVGDVYAGLGDVADRSGHAGEACSWLRRGIAMKPDLASARATRIASCGGK
jgi:tetratricopeptide (TPR) repeat protein